MWGKNRPFGRKNAILEQFGKSLMMSALWKFGIF